MNISDVLMLFRKHSQQSHISNSDTSFKLFCLLLHGVLIHTLQINQFLQLVMVLYINRQGTKKKDKTNHQPEKVAGDGYTEKPVTPGCYLDN